MHTVRIEITHFPSESSWVVADERLRRGVCNTRLMPPAGFHSVTPRILESDVAAQVQFLRSVFDATGEAVAHPIRPGR